MRKVRNNVRIVEMYDHAGWTVHFGQEKVVRTTAMGALQAVKMRDAELVDKSLADIALTVVEWEPRSRVGKAVVAAIVNTKEVRNG